MPLPLTKTFFAIVAAILLAPNFTIAKAKSPFGAQGKLSLVTPTCLSYLDDPQGRYDQQIKVIETYQRFRIGRQWDFGGFLFETLRPQTNAKVVKIQLADWNEPPWRTERWSIPNRELRFLNVGFRNLETESQIINTMFANHMQTAPGHSLIINFAPKRRAVERALVDLRWNVHDAVMETYAQKKKYLSPIDFMQLISYNSESSNNDVFALMSPSAKPIQEMDYRELRRELLMTIQISYFGTRNYLSPTLRGVLFASGYTFDNGDDRLPFEYRIPWDKLQEFRSRVYARFDKFTTCEMNRYVKFGKLEASLQAAFLLRAITTAKDRGMKTIVATADRGTAKIFKGYGFQIFDELPSDGSESDDEKEYLLYLGTGTAEYVQFHDGLQSASENVQKEEI